MSRIWVTGHQGFVGGSFAAHLDALGHTVGHSTTDLRESEKLGHEIVDFNPKAFFHFAGVSHVAHCESDPRTTYDVNVTGSLMLARAIATQLPDCTFVFASTAQVYQPSEKILDEESPVDPQNLYAQSKWLAEQGLAYYRKKNGLRLVVLRLFNHSHKSQSPDFFLPSLYSQLMKARQDGLTEPEISVGNLDLWRDIGALPDLMRALEAVTDYNPAPADPHIFNVCSGVAKNLSAIATLLARKMDLEPHFIRDPSRIRPNDTRRIEGSRARFSQTFGWQPQAENLEEMVDAFLADR